MNCPLQSEGLRSEATVDLLLDYSAGRLDREKSAPLERHMESCAQCAAFRIEQTELWNVLDAWEPEPVSLSFNRQLWQRIDEISAAPWHRKLFDALRYGAWKPAFPLAAALVIISAGFVLDHRVSAPDPQGLGATAGVSTAEVDQVERALDDIQLLRQFDSASRSGASSSKPM